MSKTIFLKLLAVLSIGVGAILSLSAFSDTPSEVNNNAKLIQPNSPELSSSVTKTLKDKLSTTLGINVQTINSSPLAGIVEVVTDQGIFYTSEDGQFLLHGQLFSLGKTVSNLTEQSLAKVRLAGLKKFENDMIVFPAKNEKYKITVFTDNTCAYCRKLHSHIDEFNEKGVTVQYLAYPRQGIKDRYGNLTQNYKDMRSIWCADNPQQAMTDSKLGKNIPYRVCDKPVAEEFEFGRQIGVNGTPALILSNGFLLPGYRKPDDIIALLNNMN